MLLIVRTRISPLFLSLLACSLFAAEPFPGGNFRLVDLTHEFSADTIYWPTASGFVLEVESRGVTSGGYFYSANRFRGSEHGGTHIDAPIHFAQDRRTVDEIPLDQLMGAAAVVSVAPKAASNPDYEITINDLTNWESQHGRLPDGAILLLCTGYNRFWPDAGKYLGTNEKGPAAVAKLHFPGLHPDAARWLVSQRRVKAVGIDTASIDHGQSTLFESHRALFEKNIPVFENIASLEQLPPTGTYVIAMPMKIKGGSGAPLRIVAWTPKR